MDLDQLRKDIRTQGLEVILMSNPRNPTGQVVQGEELKELVELSRESGTTLILDEVRTLGCSNATFCAKFGYSSIHGTFTPRTTLTLVALSLLRSSLTMSMTIRSSSSMD